MNITTEISQRVSSFYFDLIKKNILVFIQTFKLNSFIRYILSLILEYFLSIRVELQGFV